MKFKKRISFAESVLFIDEVVSTVFITDEKGNVTYAPELFAPAIHLAFCKYYGNFKKTENFDADYDIYMNTNLSYAAVAGAGVDKNQYAGLEKAIWEKINFRKEELHKTNINLVSSFDELIPVIESLLSVAAEKMAALDINKLSDKEK